VIADETPTEPTTSEVAEEERAREESQPAPAPPPPVAASEADESNDDEIAVDPNALVPAIAAALEALLHDGDRDARKKAATVLLTHEPQAEVPEHARQLARFNDAKSCNDKKKVLKEIAELADIRVLPALEMLTASRRLGCKPRGKGECGSCLRRTLSATVKQLTKASKQPKQP
jgi:hypothetical protein